MTFAPRRRLLIPILTGVTGLVLSFIFTSSALTIVALMILIIAGEMFFIVDSRIESFIARIQATEKATTNLGLDLAHLRQQTIPVSISNMDMSDPIVVHQANVLLNQFAIQLGGLQRKDFILEVELDTRLRLEILANLKSRAFATWVKSKVEQCWEQPQWNAYRSACYDAAKRIPGGFTRVFVFDGPWDVTPGIEKLIVEHIDEKVKTYAVLKCDLRKSGLDPDDDFAFWDEEWLATVIHAETAQHEVRFRKSDKLMAEYKRKTRLILSSATDARTFLEQLRTPYFDPITTSSPTTTRAIMNTAVRSDANFLSLILSALMPWESGRLCIFGACEPALEFIDSLGLGDVTDVWDLLDFPADLQRRFPKMSFRTMDRTTITEKRRLYNGAILIGISNALAYWQLHSFFKALKGAMKQSSAVLLYGFFPDRSDWASGDETKAALSWDALGDSKRLSQLLSIAHAGTSHDKTLHIIRMKLSRGSSSPSGSLAQLGLSSVPLQKVLVCAGSDLLKHRVVHHPDDLRDWFSTVWLRS